MGITKVSHFGQEMLGTVWAFLDANDLLHKFPRAKKPVGLKDTPLWLDPGSQEADDLRAKMFQEEDDKVILKNVSTFQPLPIATQNTNTRSPLSVTPQLIKEPIQQYSKHNLMGESQSRKSSVIYPISRIIIPHTPYHHIPYSLSSYTILRIIIYHTPYHHIPYSVSSYTILRIIIFHD